MQREVVTLGAETLLAVAVFRSGRWLSLSRKLRCQNNRPRCLFERAWFLFALDEVVTGDDVQPETEIQFQNPASQIRAKMIAMNPVTQIADRRL